MRGWEEWEKARRPSVLLPPDTPAGRFGPLAGLVEIWRSKRRPGALPAWRDFDFYDFVGWHGLVYVDEVVTRDPLDLRCRLWGTRLAELLGADETGKLFSESVAARDSGRVQANTRVVEEGLINLLFGRAVLWDRQVPLTVVKLPCAEDGVVVDHVLGAVWPETEGDR